MYELKFRSFMRITPLPEAHFITQFAKTIFHCKVLNTCMCFVNMACYICRQKKSFKNMFISPWL